MKNPWFGVHGSDELDGDNSGLDDQVLFDHRLQMRLKDRIVHVGHQTTNIVTRQSKLFRFLNLKSMKIIIETYAFTNREKFTSSRHASSITQINFHNNHYLK
jgi:hypothetical protein